METPEQPKRTFQAVPFIGMQDDIKQPVLTKADFVRRYVAGEFGNRAPTWDTIEEFKQSGYTGLIHIRNRRAGGPTWYNVPAEEVITYYKNIVQSGEKPDDYYFSGMAPTESTTIQGEVCITTEHHLSLFYSQEKLPMRDALRKASHYATGVSVNMLLRYYMDYSSWDWLCHLLRSYPDHVIEFSCYSVYWGTLPGLNTVFWEVRKC